LRRNKKWELHVDQHKIVYNQKDHKDQNPLK
jgi:hypothetical protein